ncbi:hypothetical protein FOZ61_008627 [Perkinsus olseni]|uniref:Uncharacterized protein n=1 Tax=Perkinsus olseni TaxID=32597 RepID=A0A7J6L2R9_PEROL|nr:hypothetical protein FOZ61_008627 [Perkinsus olseni]
MLVPCGSYPIRAYDIGRTGLYNNICLFSSTRYQSRTFLYDLGGTDSGSIRFKIGVDIPGFGEDEAVEAYVLFYPRLWHAIRSTNNSLQWQVPKKLASYRTLVRQIEVMFNSFDSRLRRDPCYLGGYRFGGSVGRDGRKKEKAAAVCFRQYMASYTASRFHTPAPDSSEVGISLDQVYVMRDRVLWLRPTGRTCTEKTGHVAYTKTGQVQEQQGEVIVQNRSGGRPSRSFRSYYEAAQDILNCFGDQWDMGVKLVTS